MAEKYQSRGKKSNRKFEVLGAKRLAMHLPLPLVEVWEELQPQVEHLTGLAGLKSSGRWSRMKWRGAWGRVTIPRPHRSACVGASNLDSWCSQARRCLVTPRVRTHEGQEVALDNYGRLQHDGRAIRSHRHPDVFWIRLGLPGCVPPRHLSGRGGKKAVQKLRWHCDKGRIRHLTWHNSRLLEWLILLTVQKRSTLVWSYASLRNVTANKALPEDMRWRASCQARARRSWIGCGSWRNRGKRRNGSCHWGSS